MEKTKSLRRKKIAKGVLLALSFILTAVITFSVTLAWFYDEDWASSMVTMAGTVGIELRDDANTTIYAPGDPNNTSLTSGAGNLHFYVLTEKAYPGQSIDVKASVFNNGGDSKQNSKDGSPAYIRARFVVYTDIGNDIDEGDTTDPENLMNSRAIYNYLLSLITEQNSDEDIPYTWQYHTTEEAYPLKNADASATLKYYYNGTSYTSAPTLSSYESYYYLCYKSGTTIKNKSDQDVALTTDKVLKPLAVGENTAFLWNSQFVIPWTLTNESADKMIFVAVQFQAIQTFIPQVNLSSMDGIISAGTDGDNQVDPTECTYDSKAVQTVFNSSNFGAIDLKIYDTDGTTVLYDFGNGQYNNSTSQTNGAAATA